MNYLKNGLIFMMITIVIDKKRKTLTFKKAVLYCIVSLLEKSCCLFHWLNPILIKLGKPHCPLALWSYRIDRKYNVGAWKSYKDEDRDDI